MFYLIRLATLLALLCFQQPGKHKKHDKTRPHPMRGNEPYIDDCVFTHKYTLHERLKKYPFNKAVKIEAVSYRNSVAEPFEDIPLKNGKPIHPPTPPLPKGLLIKNQQLNRIDIKESVVLSSKQIAYLSKLVFNIDYRTKDDSRANPGGECDFDPRVALLFYDAQGKIFDYIEVSFYCFGDQSKSGKNFLGVDCNQKYPLIRKFFLSLGIKYGTLNRNPAD